MKSEEEKCIKAIRKELRITECDIKKFELRKKLKSLKKVVVKKEVFERVS